MTKRSAKRVTAAEAAGLVKSGMWLDLAGVKRSRNCSTRRWRRARASFAT